jgi:hypothetical protein
MSFEMAIRHASRVWDTNDYEPLTEKSTAVTFAVRQFFKIAQ